MGVRGWLRLLLVALPGLFYLPYYIVKTVNNKDTPLIRECQFAGSSVPLFFAYGINRFCPDSDWSPP